MILTSNFSALSDCPIWSFVKKIFKKLLADFIPRKIKRENHFCLMPQVKINFISNQYWKISKVSSQIFNLNLIRKLTKTYTKKSRQDRRQPRMLQASLENNILLFFLFGFFHAIQQSENSETFLCFFVYFKKN